MQAPPFPIRGSIVIFVIPESPSRDKPSRRTSKSRQNNFLSLVFHQDTILCRKKRSVNRVCRRQSSACLCDVCTQRASTDSLLNLRGEGGSKTLPNELLCWVLTQHMLHIKLSCVMLSNMSPSYRSMFCIKLQNFSGVKMLLRRQGLRSHL